MVYYVVSLILPHSDKSFSLFDKVPALSPGCRNCRRKSMKHIKNLQPRIMSSEKYSALDHLGFLSLTTLFFFCFVFDVSCAIFKVNERWTCTYTCALVNYANTSRIRNFLWELPFGLTSGMSRNLIFFFDRKGKLRLPSKHKRENYKQTFCHHKKWVNKSVAFEIGSRH